MRKLFAVPAVALVTGLGAASALASSASRPGDTPSGRGMPKIVPTASTGGFAGYSSGRYDSTFRLRANLRVPSLSCSDKTAQSVVAGVTANDPAGSYFYAVGLVMRCGNGSATTYPVLDNGGSAQAGYPQDRAQPGDTVQLDVSLTKSGDLVSVVDKTHYFKVSSGPGTRGVSARWGGLIGDFPWQPGAYSPPQPVPNFGKVHFSQVLLNGSRIGLVKSVVRDQWPGKIATSAIGKDHESFTTTFEHS